MNREQRLPFAIKPVTLASAIAITTMAAFAAPADENNDASPNEDCGTASNCGGIGGWRVILLAKDANVTSAESPSDRDHVEDSEEPVENRSPSPLGSINDQTLTVGGKSATVDVAPFFSDADGDDLTYSSDE